MVTQTTRTDLKLKNCKIDAEGDFLNEDNEVLDLKEMLKAVFGVGTFDLSANTVKKDEIDLGDLE